MVLLSRVLLSRVSSLSPSNSLKAILRIYWSLALVGPILAIYHNIRTIPHSLRAGTRVGWDMICEWTNRDVKKDISRFSVDRLIAYMRRANLFAIVRQGVRDIFYAHRAEPKQYMKPVDDDVDMMKEKFRDLIGRDWKEATSPRTKSKMGLKGSMPWIEMENERKKESQKGGMFEQIDETVRRLTIWQRWTA